MEAGDSLTGFKQHLAFSVLALQLHILLISESMGFHDSEVMDDRNII